MALPASGAISLNQVNVELGNSGTANINMNSAAVRGLFGIASGAISMSDGYGKSSETVLVNQGTINGQSNRKQITVSDFIDAGGTLVVPSGFWVWSDDTAVAAMIVDIACTIKIEGKVIGKGGAGGHNPRNPTSGGAAISVTSSGVTIQNLSGAYIAGGGGGGAFSATSAGSGGGAGGGAGGEHEMNPPTGAGVGGVLNASGTNGQGFIYPSTSYNPAAGRAGMGGGAGGGGGYYNFQAGYPELGYTYAGGGGGRILPGTGGAGGSGVPQGGGTGGNGGSGSGAGANSGNPWGGVSYDYGNGGGGGWGASGGGSGSRGGASGGAAIASTTSYTLSNSGTVYGAT